MVAVLAVSCATGAGIDEFRRRLFALVPEPVLEEAGEEPDLLEYLAHKR